MARQPVSAAGIVTAVERGLRWRWVAIALAGLVAMQVAIIGLYGTGEEAIRVTLRATARTSVAFFLPAYAASALHRLRRRPWTAWLVRNRRYLGLSVAASHTFHLAAIALLIPHLREDEGGWPVVIGGGGAFVVMYAMAATSNDAAVRWLGTARWRRLHTIGLHWLWFVFAVTFAGGAAAGSAPSEVATALLVAALGVRILAHRAATRPLSAAAP